MANPDTAHDLKALVVQTHGRLAEYGRTAGGRVRRFIDGPSSGVLPDAIPFQSDIERIALEPPSPLLRVAPYVATVLLLLLTLVAGLVQLDVVVAGPGRMVTDSPPVVLQPMDRAIIRELLVKNGDRVHEGQVLARLDPTFAEADKKTLVIQMRSVEALIRRLDAEARNVPYEVRSAADADDALQLNVYKQRKAYHASRLAVFDGELKGLAVSLRNANQSKELLSQQLDIAKDLEGMRQSLMQSQTGSRLQLMEAQSNRTRSEREVADTRNRIIELRHGTQAKRAERQAFLEEWQRQILEELVRARTEVNRLTENLAKVSMVRDMIEVVAPEDAVVLERAKRSVGSIIQAGEPLVTLVSANAPLIAEVRIPSSEIGFAKPGDHAIIKIDAYPYIKHGKLDARLRSISLETFQAGELGQPEATRALAGKSEGGAYHRAELEITANDLRDLPQGGKVTPGMTVTAEIIVGKRSVLGFFLSPLTRGLTEKPLGS